MGTNCKDYYDIKVDLSKLLSDGAAVEEIFFLDFIIGQDCDIDDVI